VRRPDLGVARDLGQILDEAFALLRAYARTLLPIALGVVVPINLVVSGIGLGQLTDGYDASPEPGITVLQTLVTLLITTPLITAMHVHVVLAAAAGRPVSARSAFAAGLDVFAPLLGALVLAVAGVGLGLLAFVLPGIYVGVMWSFTAQAVVVDGRRGPQALARSAELVRGKWWWVFGVLVVTNLVATVLSLVVAIPADLVADAVDSQAVALAGTTLAQVFTLSLLALTSTLLYFSLRVRKGEPAPSAGVADREEAAAVEGLPPGAAEPPVVPGGFEPPRAGGG
jgi:hypothetical protein